jgi:hypothetical protein
MDPACQPMQKDAPLHPKRKYAFSTNFNVFDQKTLS